MEEFKKEHKKMNLPGDYNESIDYSLYKEKSKYHSTFDVDSLVNLKKAGWTSNEIWWLIQVLESLSRQQLIDLLKIIDEVDWEYQKNAGYFEDPKVTEDDFIGFILCDIEHLDKEEAKRKISEFLRSLRG